MKRVTVFGAGAVGGHLAARLASHSAHTLSVVARGEQLAAIRAGGVELAWPDGRIDRARVTATNDPATLPPQDVVIVALKQPSLRSAAADLRTLLHAGTIVGFVQNGIPWWHDGAGALLDPDGALHATFPAKMIVGVVAHSANEVIRPGVIRTDSVGGDTFAVGAAVPAGRAAATALADLLADAGINSPLHTDLRPVIWNKLLLNVAYSGPATLVGGSVGQIAATPELRRFARSLGDEIVTIATALGIAGVERPSPTFVAAMERSRHVPSLLQDLRRRRQPELDALFGAPLDLAQRLKIGAPKLRLLHALLTARWINGTSAADIERNGPED